MRVRAYLYNSESAAEHVPAVLDRVTERDAVELVDVGEGDDARREAMFALRESVRIGDNPEDIYGDDGTPEFATGVLVTEDATGRRSLQVGREALDVLEETEG